jgi:hypothetical protein
LFGVGGASAVAERFRLDRHWRNAHTLASHNPVIYRDRLVGCLASRYRRIPAATVSRRDPESNDTAAF